MLIPGCLDCTIVQLVGTHSDTLIANRSHRCGCLSTSPTSLRFRSPFVWLKLLLVFLLWFRIKRALRLEVSVRPAVSPVRSRLCGREADSLRSNNSAFRIHLSTMPLHAALL